MDNDVQSAKAKLYLNSNWPVNKTHRYVCFWSICLVSTVSMHQQTHAIYTDLLLPLQWASVLLSISSLYEGCWSSVSIRFLCSTESISSFLVVPVSCLCVYELWLTGTWFHRDSVRSVWLFVWSDLFIYLLLLLSQLQFLAHEASKLALLLVLLIFMV